MRGCTVTRRYIYVFNCDMFSVVYVYHDHLKFCGVCIYGQRYVCCSECHVVSDELTSCLVQPVGAHGGEDLYIWSALGVNLVSGIVILYMHVS